MASNRQLLISLLFVYLTVLYNIPICYPQPSSSSLLSPLEAKYFEQEDAAIIVDKLLHQEDQKWIRNNCDKYKCFDPLHCEINAFKQLLYYVYPPLTFLDAYDRPIYTTRSMISREYWQVLRSILSSGSRITLDPDKACFFVPSIDLTWLSTIHPLNTSLLTTIYDSLPYWRYVDGKPGTNHLVISLDLSHNLNRISASIERAVLVAPGHDTWTLRPDFDFSIPAIQTVAEPDQTGTVETTTAAAVTIKRAQWKLISTQYGSIGGGQRAAVDNLEALMQGDFLVLSHNCLLGDLKGDTEATSADHFLRCDKTMTNTTLDQAEKTACRCSKDGLLDFRFPQLLSMAQYCLLLHPMDEHGAGNSPLGDSGHYLLGQALRHGCVPIVSSDMILPYDHSSILDWSKMSIRLTNNISLGSIATLIASINSTNYQRMSYEAERAWQYHFQSPSQIGNNIMRHFDSTVFPKALIESLRRYRTDL